MLSTAFLLGIVVALYYLGNANAHTKPGKGWNTAHVTGYSTRENLTGCYAPGQCRTACGVNLNDRKFWVAANPRWGLGCGQRIQVCGKRCAIATVMDKTASHFDFEFTYALAVSTGAPNNYPGFANPRYIKWRKYYGKG